MFSKSSMLSFLTIALGATSALSASIPVRRVEPEISSLSRRDSSGGYISMAYFVNWAIYARNFQPSDIDTSTLTHILYAFMDVDPASGHIKLSDSYADTDKHYPDDSWDESGNNVYGCIKQMYALKLANRNLKISFSVGGWTYAQAGHFNFATDATMRATFVSDAITYIENFGFDGIDIDWEYPNTDDDSAAFTSLMSELRSALDDLATKKGDSTPYYLTAAVSAGPQVYKYYQFADVDKSLSFWNLMSYDYAGSWSNYSADNANVYYGETTGFNTDQAVQAYIKGGASANKIMMGMPLYGRSFEKTAGIYQTFDGIGTADESNGSYEAGVYDFKHLPLSGGTVTENTTSVASYSYDSTKQELISFDTANIIKLKTQYLMKQGLAGSMFWELSGDKTGSDSLVGVSASTLGSLDTTQNHINYPNSIYDNIKNNLGGSSGSTTSGSSGSSSTSASSSSTASTTASSSTEASSTEASSTTVVSTTASSSTTVSSSTTSPTTTGNTCAAKRRT